MIKVLLITPPFTQLNSPYPATACLKGFLNEQNIESHQCDLSIELFNRIYTREIIARIFVKAKSQSSIAFSQVWQQQQHYLSRVDAVLKYLRQPDESSAGHILDDRHFPRAHRAGTFNQASDEAFKALGMLDKAKYVCTQFVEELGDFIRANIDEFFSFTRYAEQLAVSASSFDTIDEYLQYEPTLIEEQLMELLEHKLGRYKPGLVCFTIPFPGNLFSALRCSQFIKQYNSAIKVAFGGGYCSTELLSLTDPAIFSYLDYIVTGDGEGPLLKIIQFLNGEIGTARLERTFILHRGKVVYRNHLPNTVYHHKQLPAPSYADLPRGTYLSFLDVINPMHRLWSDGNWNKMTLAHGCYWKQCAFCDITLDYIRNYQITTAHDLVLKIKKVAAETGISDFHFVDEAAPPKVLKALAEQLIEQNIKIKWWTNIRFEKTFTPELCALLAASGCIAVTGGLETASDRLLLKMNKGVDIRQVARVTRALTDNHIMVHAYLMYGFPTQTPLETIDSLEIVRQLFENKCIQSAFWHLFTATVHSPVGKDPGRFGIKITGPGFKGFAMNGLEHEDPTGACHADFTKGLNLALDSYLKGTGFDLPLQHWFDFNIGATTHAKEYISLLLSY